MLANTTNRISIVIDGREKRRYTVADPMTISEVWHDARIRKLGPSRMARLGADGVAYVSITKSGYAASLKRRGLVT